MFGSIILEVAIGIVFIYLFLSLISSVITELISSIFQLRSTNLATGIRRLVADTKVGGITDAIYNHPLIAGLSLDGRKPSYIPSHKFAQVFIDIINSETSQTAFKSVGQMRVALTAKLELLKSKPNNDGILNIEVVSNILLFLNEAGDDLGKVQKAIEDWFDGVMERASGWYKRKTQWIILVLSLMLAVLFNVDTIHLAKSLYRDSNLRSGLVAAAEAIAKQPQLNAPLTAKSQPQDVSATGKQTESINDNGVDAMITQINDNLAKLEIPIGWNRDANRKTKLVIEKDDKSWIFTIFGWVLTAIAVSLGAPFWFDTLSKFINIRAAGSKPEK